MTQQDKIHDHSCEHVRYWRPRGLSGVECMRASFRTQNFSRHFHDGYAIGVIEQGAMAFDYLGQRHVASQGLVNLVVPGEIHDGHAAGNDGWTYRMFYLEPDLVARAVREMSGREMSGRSASMPHFRAGVLADPLLASRVYALHWRMQPGVADCTVLERETRLLELLVLWIRRHGAEPPKLERAGREHAAVRRARQYLADNLAEDVSLGELAGVCNLSPFYLARVFSRSVGAPPHAYLSHLRLEKARHLLRMPSGSNGSGLFDMSLAQVAAATGFADQSHMTRRFKRVLGITPGQYRKNVQYS